MPALRLPSHTPSLALSGALLLIPALALAGNPDTIAAPPDTQAIWGGEDTEACAWPSVVMVTGGGSLCSATLIHPKVVLYAAHCGAQGKTVQFGDSQNGAKSQAVEYCKVNPSYNGNSQGNDWAYCVLQNEVTQIPFTPVAYGCEVAQYAHNGADVALVGFGNDSGDSGAGRKRWAFSKMSQLSNSTFDVGGNGLPTICSGDSGGPAFIRFADGTWHHFGIASTKYDNTCTQAGGTHSRSHNAAKWVEDDSGIDVTVCHDTDGTWNPTYLCGGFFDGQPALGYGSWYTWCEDATASDWSDTCGEDFGVNAESAPPDLQIVVPADGESFIGAPTMFDIEVAVADQSGFWDVQIEIEGMLQPTVVSDQNPTVFAGAQFYAGEYTLVAHAIDFWGNEAASAPVTFTVVTESSDSGGTTEGGGTTDTGADTSESSESGPLDGGGLDEVGDAGVADEGGDCSCKAEGELGNSGWAGLVGLGLLGLRRRKRELLDVS